MIRKPPFTNDDDFTNQIEANVEPNRRFPFVQLKSLVEENSEYLASLTTSKTDKSHKSQNKTAGVTLRCHICPKTFTHKTSLSYHLGHCHPEVKKPFVCSICPTKFYKTVQELNLHLGAQHPDQFKVLQNGKRITVIKWECPHCPKKFASASHLNEHINRHTKETSYICDVCGSKYVSARKLRSHKLKKNCKRMLERKASRQLKKSDNNEDKYLSCLFCGYKAASVYILECHNRTHTGEKPFECKACGYKVAIKTRLNKHILLNCPKAKAIGLEPDSNSTGLICKCHICSKEFYSQSALTYHLSHYHPEVEKPFACSLCTESYGTSTDLTLHLGKQHPDEFKLERKRNVIVAKAKRIPCPHCPQKCTTQSTLIRHISSHDAEGAFMCDVCGLKYRRKEDLGKHKSRNKCKPVPEQIFDPKSVATSAELSSKAIKNEDQELLESSDAGLEEDEIKYEIPFPVDPLALDMDSNYVEAESKPSFPIDPNSSGGQSVTNELVLVESNVFSTTYIFKIEH